MSAKTLILIGLLFIVLLFLVGLALAFLPSSVLGSLQRKIKPASEERGPGDDPA